MSHHSLYQRTGAFYNQNGDCDFVVWAPFRKKVDVCITHPQPQTWPMQQDDFGYWSVTLPIAPGARYVFILDGELQRPDPASLSQPDSVHGASEVVSRDFEWHDADWAGIEKRDLVIYELHTGTFSPEHTFEGIINKLDYLQQLGITAIELMPVNQFPGKRNWGYDGAYPFAVQHNYGGVQGLKRLVDAAHLAGIAVILDVVYNHLGPDGNYLNDFGPYFTDKYKTPWGAALNYDSAWCDGVRNYYLQNALQWLDEFHIDGLRMDAVHAIWDFSAHHFMQQLKEAVQALEQQTGSKKILIAEIDLNNTRYINPAEKGGYNLDAQWIDEFHHAVHSVLTGEVNGYYEDFGKMLHIEKAFRDTYVYNGNYSVHRKKNFGSSVVENPYDQFVVFTQNHDQTGNRLMGDRLGTLVSYEALKLAAAATLLSPYIPLLFMGEEYGEKNPFLFFVDHENEQLAEIVRKGRREEFAYFKFEGDFPDPQDVSSFDRSVLSWNIQENPAATMLAYYQTLIQLRKTHTALQGRGRNSMQVQGFGDSKLLVLQRTHQHSELLICFNFDKAAADWEPGVNFALTKLFDSAATEWNGPGSAAASLVQPGERIEVQPESVVVFEKHNH
ncbi:malto-oligosyltrehalose trehalohydrolase [Deminuibacter soli]|uniref:Malto-oligosyltrehalose trehalohydrolase n=1 Tax=Deminuibacter soli TaxID=2291815 RepID=A0A3E1NQY2_9BACT|nr:malto-oligosyltrehalose trehalohydrolase [Deminuibacter soli]RFM30342.1 malto-oligosyltrehalose trehalohydrolase [Deminuibacter soli]